MTRRVGPRAVTQLRCALESIDEASEQAAEEAMVVSKKIRAMVIEGRVDEAQQFGLREQTRLHMLLVSLGAKLEEAAVELLGERRQPNEDLATYAARIRAAGADLPTMVEVQRRNGITLVLDDPE